MSSRYTLGVDVGTGSARAGLFDLEGRLVGEARHDIAIYHGVGGVVEQSSRNIWSAVCACVREALRKAAVAPEAVVGVGFDATCSLVAIGPGGASVAIGPTDDPDRDVIVWMDHRAVAQAKRINAGKYDVLKYVGGRISPEMETPKLLWLAENKPDAFARAWQFFDLADFLTWRATGSLKRSMCTVTCKWTYLAHERRWDEAYFRAIGLAVLADENFARIGTEVVEPGSRVGGLTAEAASALGLLPGTPVAAALIDAHAGGVGTIGAVGSPEENLAYVFGTSSCTMTTTKEAAFVPGVWGPYYAAMAPGAWLLEGGQSAAGAALERLVSLHPEAAEHRKKASSEALSLPAWLAREAEGKGGDLSEVAELAGDLVVVPEFLGNRAPFADPEARAVIAGLGMETGFDSLMALYVAGVCGIAYGLRQIIEAQDACGVSISRIVVSGGAAQSRLVRQLLADATGKAVFSVRSPEPVLLGSAMLGAVASSDFPNLEAAMTKMSTSAECREPTRDALIARRHATKYLGFQKLQTAFRFIRTHQ